MMMSAIAIGTVLLLGSTAFVVVRRRRARAAGIEVVEKRDPYERLPKLVAKELRDNDQRRKQLIKIEPDVIVAEQLLAAFPQFTSSMTTYGWSAVQVFMTLTSFKGDVAPVLRWLGKRGYKQTSTPTTYTGHETTRSYTCGAIHIQFSATSCKRVKTGTKMVEEPIYEIQCD